jgi:2-polyprenyl-6-methoxyphenol hydroxylase-like FAD-dependent oxidoreductase
VRFEDGSEEGFALVVGADGMHSRVRELTFGPERRFARFLGLHVAAFHVASDGLRLYPLSEHQLDATFLFRHAKMDVPHAQRFAFLRERFRAGGWITQDVLHACGDNEPIFFNSVTQILMPQWHRGRIAPIGDACGGLTLLAGQSSHIVMAGGYLLAQELARQSDHAAALSAYQNFLKPYVDKKRKDAARFARMFVPTPRSRPWLRRLAIRLLLSRPLINLGLVAFGAKSILAGRR